MGDWKRLVTLDIEGGPATFGAATTLPWKHAVSTAFEAWAAEHPARDPAAFRYFVDIEFRLRPSRHVGEVWDIDNLVKPTLDAMGAVFGNRVWRGPVQAADDRVDRLVAQKRQPREGERPGALITVQVKDA